MSNVVITDLTGNITYSSKTKMNSTNLFSILPEEIMNTVLDMTSSNEENKVVLLKQPLLDRSYTHTLIFKTHQELNFIEFKEDLSKMIEKLYEITNIQATKIRSLTKQVKDSNLFEEITKLNNQLANAQRELAKKNQRLLTVSYTDELTKLNNRRKFFEYIRSRNTDSLVLSVDIDNFKTINDTLGHLEGDNALIYFSDLLNKTFTDNTTLYRMGGDEFCIITDVEKLQEAEGKLKQVSSTLGEKYKNVSLSYGHTIVPKDYKREELDSLLVQADTKMYQGKKKKKNV